MGSVVNCKYEFLIRQRLHRVQRAIKELGYCNRVFVVIEPDADSDVGFSISMVDSLTHRRRVIYFAEGVSVMLTPEATNE